MNSSKLKRWIVVMISSVLLVATVALRPTAAMAFGAIVFDPEAAIDRIKTFIEKNGKTIANTTIRTALNTFLSKLAYDSAVFIASGLTGQTPAVHTDQIGPYLLKSGDAAIGGAIEGFATSTGLDAAGLCDPGEDFRINLTLGLETNFGQATQPYKPACTLTELGGNWKKAYSDPNFDKYFEWQFDSTANPLGVALEIQNLTLEKKVQAIEEAAIQRQKSDFKDKAALVSKGIVTPGSVLQEKFFSATDQSNFIMPMVEEPAVNALNIFMTTLVTKLMEKFKNGIVPVNSGQDLTALLSVGGATGRQAAEAMFADLKQPVFTSSGAFDVLAELSTCSAASTSTADNTASVIEPTVNNCAIGVRMREAIVQRMSVKEFVDVLNQSSKTSFFFADDNLQAGGNIPDDAGLTYKGILLLKKYRIVPVGWQLAAEYIRNEVSKSVNDDGTTSSAEIPTLQQIVNCYSACGGSTEEAQGCELLTPKIDGSGYTTYSPYCKLIDPDWVLKAPQNYCERQGAGSDLAISTAIDDDANPSTQQAYTVSRLDYCADDRGCIAEDDKGNCTAYGYCTKENRIYRFQGTSCEAPYASCQTFKDEDGEEVSYVKSSINYDDCATDPGCQWYCNSKDGTGNFNCASSTSTFISCDASIAATTNDAFTYESNASCSCTWQQTCTVKAGSDRGYDDGDGVYDYWQCKITNTIGPSGSSVTCSLDDTCGVDNPAYDSKTGMCTCTLSQNCSVEEGSSRCEVSPSSSTKAICDLGSSCTTESDTYRTTPVCQPTGAMNCGDTCTVSSGTDSCVNSLGNTCVDGSEQDGDGTKNGRCTLEDSCAVNDGASSCTSSSGNICIIGINTETPAEHNDTLYFDSNAEECSSQDAGCNKYLRSNTSANLLPNALFTYNTTGENVRNFVGFCSMNGNGCATDAECGNVVGACKGWLQNDANIKVYTSSEDNVNDTYVELTTDDATGGALTNTVDTGYSLSNRTFTLVYRARRVGDADCSAGASFGTTEPKYQAISTYTEEWTDYFGTYTFADDDTLGSSIRVSINATAACPIDVNAVQLTESDSFNNVFTDYGSNEVYLNGNTISCQAEDVGCELYTPAGGSNSSSMPGIITNADSDVCVTEDGAYDYSNPACNQCSGNVAVGQTDEYYVGCDFYQVAALTTTSPIQLTDVNIAGDQLDEKAIAAGMVRTGYYCSGDNSTHCYDNDDCSDNGICQPLTSIVPSTAKQCSVAQVGCEEYTNLAAVEQGGEGIEYYTQLQQCVKTSDDDIATFYTFEGSNSGGVQAQDHLLKKNSDGSPCTHLDLLSQEFNAECLDSTDENSSYYVHDCGPSGENTYGTNPDCRQYVNDTGEVFYRYESETIPVSDDCSALRNSLDGRTYYALPSSSNSCNAQAVGCREYKGTDSGDITDIINEDFSSNGTDGWEGAKTTANESVLNGDYSLQFSEADNNTITHNLATTDSSGTKKPLLSTGQSYILTFWAKVAQSAQPATFKITGISADTHFTTQGSTTNVTDATVTLDPFAEGGWQYYKLGPVVLNTADTINGDEAFVMQYQGAGEAYIDTIQLIESSSQYLIQDTARLCQNFEGCREYVNRANTTQYLKSFQRLCDETAVGCEALINTQNSTNPFAEGFALDNEYSQDDTIVPADVPITVVYDEQNVCSEQVYGCAEVGEPNMDERTGHVETYTQTYRYNRPDEYDSILCEQPQLACRQYTSTYDGTSYFKDPGDKVCELQTYHTSENITLQGWFKADSKATTPDCPLQYEDVSSDYTSQPLGGVCNSNSVVHNGDVVVDNRIGALCTTDADCYPNGWQSGLPTPRCISDPADDVDEYSNTAGTCKINGEDRPEVTSEAECELIFENETQVGGDDSATWNWIVGTESDDGLSLAQERGEDYGWVGQCPAEQSGCTEYIDPYSPNIEELNENWSFEYDAFDNYSDSRGSSYQEGVTPNGFPDDWMVMSDVDINGDGQCNEDDFNCGSSPSVIMTTAPSYLADDSADSPTVQAADGASAVKIQNGLITNGAPLDFEFDLDPTQSYTLQAMVKIPTSGFATDSDGNTNAQPATFSIGLLYYYNSDSLVPMPEAETYITAHRMTIPFDSSNEGNLSNWYRLEGNFGLGTAVPLPTHGCTDVTYYNNMSECLRRNASWKEIQYVRVFITADEADVPVYFDAVSIKKNDRYYYVDYTVDGTSEYEQSNSVNSCTGEDSRGEITADGGCVAFRDTTSDTQTLAQDGLACATCLVNPTSETCRGILDACDANTVLKVKRDRECSEWLACQTAYVADKDGQQIRECFNIKGCTKLDENGNCANWATTPSLPDGLNSSSDIQFTSAEGDTDSLTNARDLTGYVKAGLTWGNERFCTSMGDPERVNHYCSDDVDCYVDGIVDEGEIGACGEPFTVQGYYPYGWMQETANYNSHSTDLIKSGIFEELFCYGEDADHTQSCTQNASGTDDSTSHCYRTEFSALLADTTKIQPEAFYDTSDDSTKVTDPTKALTESTYYCPNTPEFADWPFTGWGPLAGGKVRVSQYDSEHDCVADDYGFSDGCPDVDVNNVLTFTPALQTQTYVASDGSTVKGGKPFSGGVQYDFNAETQILGDANYALSFDGRYNGDYKRAEEGTKNPSAMSICLHYSPVVDASGNAVDDLKDCFVDGYGSADIVFVVDASKSMQTPIDQVKEAAPKLAQALADGGISTRFALVLMTETNSDSKVWTNAIKMDFSSVADFTNAIDSVTVPTDHSVLVDPWQAVVDVTTNTFDDLSAVQPDYISSLTYRSNSSKFIILVTDTGDELGVDSDQDAVTAAVSAETPVFVITKNGDFSDEAFTPKNAVEYYSNLASSTSGGVSDDLNSADWVKDTTIVNDISALVKYTVDIFQLDNGDMKTYTFGPLKTENLGKIGSEYRVAPGATLNTTLEFLSANENETQIDNVSMLPVLEVNKNLTPIARSCRAFPASDAQQCDYTDTKRTTYRGWHGYCLEQDPTNTQRCITWWPLDVIVGESSLIIPEFRSEIRADVYHCMVSKGYEKPGFCMPSSGDVDDVPEGRGISCTTEQTCINALGAGATCFRGELLSPFSDSTTNLYGVPEPADDLVADQVFGAGSYKSCTQYHTDNPTSFYAQVCDDSEYSSSSAGDVICTQQGSGDNITYSCPKDNGAGCTPALLNFINVYYSDGALGEITSADEIYPTCNSFNEEYTCQGQETNCTGNVQTQATMESEWSGQYHSKVLAWNTPSLSSDDEDRGVGYVSKFAANPITKNIHVSEIDTIEYNTGLAGDTGNTDINILDDVESPYWGQANGQVSNYDYNRYNNNGTTGNIWLTDFEHGSIVRDATGKVDPNHNFCYATSEKDAKGVGCGVWGLYDYADNFKIENYQTDYVPDGVNDYDLVYVWAWSDFNEDNDRHAQSKNNAGAYPWDGEKIDGVVCNSVSESEPASSYMKTLAKAENSGYWLTSTCIEPAVKCVMGTDSCNDGNAVTSQNPWKHLTFDIRKDINNTENKNAMKRFVGSNGNTNTSTGHVDSWRAWKASPDSGYNGVTSEGGNIQSLYIDFNDNGYVQDIYHMFYYDAEDTEDSLNGVQLTYKSPMYVNFYVRESCALVANTVDAGGMHKGWTERLSGTDGYHLVYDNYGARDDKDTTNDPFGAISPQTSTPEAWDTFSSKEYPLQFKTYGVQPVVVNNIFPDTTTTDGPLTAGYPTACIGNCEQRWCVGNTQKIGSTCETNEECTPDSQYGVGVCMGVGDSAVSGAGYSFSSAAGKPLDYNGQLSYAASASQARLKHVFANVIGDFYRFDPKYDSSTDGADYIDTRQVYVKDQASYWNDPSEKNIFDTMKSCSDWPEKTVKNERPDSLGTDAEYCGVFPEVLSFVDSSDSAINFTIDGYQPSDGYYQIDTNPVTVSISVTVNADSNQEPITQIYLDFGDGKPAAKQNRSVPSGTYTFSHSYECKASTPGYDADDASGPHCVFKPKVVAVDNWNWCSGKEKEDSSLNLGSAQNRFISQSESDPVFKSCNSYDEMPVSIRMNAN